VRRRRNTHRRGRTRPHRLALLDRLLRGSLIPLPRRAPLRVADVGFGDEPATTWELCEALQEIYSSLMILGVEEEEIRVSRAQKTTSQRISFRLGGFDLPALSVPPFDLVRCMNVLRGYGQEKCAEAQRAMLGGIAPGGLLMEGSTDTEGHLATAHLWRRRSICEIEYEGLVLATDFERGFSPRMFGDVLPRDLRRSLKGNEPAFQWLSHFERIASCLRSTLPRFDRGNAALLRERNRRLFFESASSLAQDRKDTFADPAWLERGALLWRPERPSSRSVVLSPGPLVSQAERLPRLARANRADPRAVTRSFADTKS
jgi:hypothetical protein